MCNKGITQFYLPPTHDPYLPLLPSRKASPPFGRYQLVLLGEQRHIGVKNLPRVFTPRARPRLEPTTSRSQGRRSTDSTTTPRLWEILPALAVLFIIWYQCKHTVESSDLQWLQCIRGFGVDALYKFTFYITLHYFELLLNNRIWGCEEIWQTVCQFKKK